MVYQEPIGFRSVTEPEKVMTLARLFISPMTPKDFRQLIASEKDFTFAGIMYDTLLTKKLKNRRVSPLESELRVMIDLKTWWLGQLTQETLNKLSQIYLKTAGKFLINLTRNYPYKNNPPFLVLRNGVPIWDLERILGIVLSREAVIQIMKQIQEKGGPLHYYEVWIRQNHPTNPTRWDVIVTNIDDDIKKLREYGCEVEDEEDEDDPGQTYYNYNLEADEDDEIE